MTNFNPAQFIGTWAGFEASIRANYNVGRGGKCAQNPKDVLFMLLAVFKHGGTWDVLARMFGQKRFAFERMVLRFIQLLSKPLYEHYVSKQTKR